MADSGNPSLAGGTSGAPSPSPSPPPASDSGVAWSSSRGEKTEKELDPEAAAMEMIEGDGVQCGINIPPFLIIS